MFISYGGGAFMVGAIKSRARAKQQRGGKQQRCVCVCSCGQKTNNRVPTAYRRSCQQLALFGLEVATPDDPWETFYYAIVQFSLMSLSLAFVSAQSQRLKRNPHFARDLSLFLFFFKLETTIKKKGIK